jgi:hypothetical protein
VRRGKTEQSRAGCHRRLAPVLTGERLERFRRPNGSRGECGDQGQSEREPKSMPKKPLAG